MTRERAPLAERFWANVSRGGPSDCWPWTGSKNHKGYGTIHRNGKAVKAHRVAWELQTSSPIPDGMTIDHLCGNGLCQNAAHMEVVTREENARRARLRITHCPNGHLYDEANTRISSDGDRHCRECDRASNRRYYHAARRQPEGE